MFNHLMNFSIWTFFFYAGAHISTKHTYASKIFKLAMRSIDIKQITYNISRLFFQFILAVASHFTWINFYHCYLFLWIRQFRLCVLFVHTLRKEREKNENDNGILPSNTRTHIYIVRTCSHKKRFANFEICWLSALKKNLWYGFFWCSYTSQNLFWI